MSESNGVVAETHAPPSPPPPSSPSSGAVRGRIAFALKAAVSLGILWFTFSRIDARSVLDTASTMKPGPLILATTALAASIIAAALRWSLLTRRSASIGAAEAISTTFAAQFAGNVLPSSLGQDAVRALLSRRPGRDFAETVSVIFLDRLCGVMGLCALMVMALPQVSALGRAEEAREATLVSLALAGAALAAALLIRLAPRLANAPRIVAKLFDAARLASELLTSRQGLIAVGASILVQSLVLLSLWLIAQSLGVRLSLQGAFATVPAAMFVSLLPISINGWGVREGAMVFSLGLAGVSGTDALATSLIFGGLLLVVSLPGAVTLLSKGRS